MVIDGTSEQGNAYFILGKVQEFLEYGNRSDEWPEVEARMKSGDYNNLCDVAEEVTGGTIKVLNRP